MKIKPNDYHDYVIKNGKFVGKFEEMYQNCRDPWNQDKTDMFHEDAVLSILKNRKYKKILDIGCGKGRFTNDIKKITGASIKAIDISPTAVQIARDRYPEIEFYHGKVPPIKFPDESFDLVISSGILWYLLPVLSDFFLEIKRILRKEGHYLLKTPFYQPNEQTYGNDILKKPEDLIKILPFKILHTVKLNVSNNLVFIALTEKS